MADKKFSQFTAGSTNQVPTDVLVGLDLSLSTANQNTQWTLNNLFSTITRNITDGALRFGGFAAPSLSSAGTGAIYFDSTGNVFKVSSNGGAFATLGDLTGSFGASGYVAYANGTKSLTGSADLTFSGGALTVGAAGTPGGVRLVATSGNYWNIASSTPASNRTFYFPDSTTPTTGNFLFVGTFGATVVTDWTTGLTWSNTTKQLTITSSTNGQIGFTAQNTSAGTAAESLVGFTANGGAISLLSLTGTGFTTSGLYHANQLYWRGTTGITDITFALDDASTNFRFGVNSAIVASINATSTEGLVLGIASTLTGRVKLYNSAGATYTQISAGNAASSLNYILPATSPTAGQVLSASAPSGSDVTLSWASNGTIGGSVSSGQVAYGTGVNTLGSNSAFTYNSITNVLDVGFSTSGVVQSAQLKSPQITSGTAASITGTLEFYNSTNTNLTRFQVGAAASALTYIWPAADPTAGQVLSAAAPSGGNVVLSWATASGGSPGGSGSELQYRSGASTFGAVTNSSVSGANIATQGTVTQTVSSANAFTVGPNGTTNPTLNVITNVASAATGLSITGNAAGSGVTLTALSSSGNESIILSPKGTGNLSLATGLLSFTSPPVGAFIQSNSASANTRYIEIANTSGALYVGVENSTGGGLFTGGSAYASAIGSGSSRVFQIASNNTVRTTYDTSGNMILGATAAGTSAAKVLAIASGTAPSTSPADMAQLWVADAAAGDAQLFARNEAGSVARLTGNLAYLTAQFDVASNTTPQSITGLLRNVEAGTRYKFEALLWCTCGTTGGVQIAMNGGTATATSVIFESQLYDDVTTFALINSARFTALNTGNSTASTTGYFYRISGTILVNAAGTFGPAFAQSVSNGTNSSVLVNSSFQIWQA